MTESTEERTGFCSVSVSKYLCTYPPTIAPILVLMGVIGEGAEVGVVSVTMGVVATLAVGYPRHLKALENVFAPVDDARVAMIMAGRRLWVVMWMITVVACVGIVLLLTMDEVTPTT